MTTGQSAPRTAHDPTARNTAFEMTNELTQKLKSLRALLRSLESALIAFSGGVDSTFLAKVALESRHQVVHH